MRFFALLLMVIVLSGCCTGKPTRFNEQKFTHWVITIDGKPQGTVETSADERKVIEHLVGK